VVSAYGANTNQGIVRTYNEDRVAIILNITRPKNKPTDLTWPSCSFFGVYDGHGGNTCADFLRDYLHQFVSLLTILTAFFFTVRSFKTSTSQQTPSPLSNKAFKKQNDSFWSMLRTINSTVKVVIWIVLAHAPLSS